MDSLAARLFLRPGENDDVDACVSLWVDACATRDGQRIAGVADRARPKFSRSQTWIVATGADGRIAGFVLATAPGSGYPSDPTDAPVIGLLAVQPKYQGIGLGGRLLGAAERELATQGHPRAVLHVLTDNAAALHVYTTHGWMPSGAPVDHALLHRPMQTYVRELPPPAPEAEH